MSSKLNETNPQGALPGSSFKYTPLQHLRWLYCRFVQGLFYAAPRGAYHWDPNENLSEIWVTSENTINSEKVGSRPAITFTRGPVQFFTLGLDDMVSYQFDTGQKEKSVLVPGTMSVNCMSRNDLESEAIAWIVAENLWMNRDMLMQFGFFEVGRNPIVGAPSAAGSLVSNDSGREWYVTTVSCPFQLYRTGKLTPLGQAILGSIDMSLRTDVQPFEASTGYPYDPSGLPYNIEASRPPAFSSASDVNGGSPNPGTSAPRLPLQPHPLNPAQMVTVRSVRPSQQGVRPPSMNGRPIPITEVSVEESPSSVEVTSTVKV